MKYFVIQDGGPVPQVGSHAFYDHVYEAMREARAGLPCVAVSSTTYRIDEFVNVIAVMRQRDGVEEWLGRANAWQAADPGGTVRLPLTEEELGRLQWIASDLLGRTTAGPATSPCGTGPRSNRGTCTP